MTLAQDVGRSRRKEGDVRDRPPDRLPQPRAVRREARELAVRVQAFAVVYALETEALVALGSSDVHVTSSPGSQTEATWADRENEAARDRCRDAVKLLRQAAANVEEALRAFGPLAEQPSEPSRYAVVDRATFDRALHRKREEALRSG